MLNTAGINSGPAWGSVRLYWGPGVSGASAGAVHRCCWGCWKQRYCIVQCDVPSGLSNQHCCMTPVARISPAGLPRSCRVERSQSPVCRTSSLLCPRNSSFCSSTTKDLISATGAALLPLCSADGSFWSVVGLSNRRVSDVPT